jgi:hypothetical protein
VGSLAIFFSFGATMEFTIKRKPNYYLVALIIIWLLGVFALSISVLIGLYTVLMGTNKAGFYIDGGFIICLIFLFAGIFVFRQLLWQLRGVEKIIIADTKIKIKKEGTFWTFPIEYELQYIDKFRLAYKDPTPFFLKIYGFTGGKIEFKYMEMTKRFGQTIETNEAKKIVEELNIELQKAHDSSE